MEIGYQRAAIIAAKLLIERHPNSVPNANKLLEEAALPTGGFNVALVLHRDQPIKFHCRVCLDFLETGAKVVGHRRFRGEIDLFWPGLNLTLVQARTDDMVIIDREESL